MQPMFILLQLPQLVLQLLQHHQPHQLPQHLEQLPHQHLQPPQHLQHHQPLQQVQPPQHQHLFNKIATSVQQ